MRTFTDTREYTRTHMRTLTDTRVHLSTHPHTRGHTLTHAGTRGHTGHTRTRHAHACVRTTYVSFIRGKRELCDLHTVYMVETRELQCCFGGSAI